MKFLHRTAAAFAALLVWAGAAAQGTVEIDGVFYNLIGNKANIVAPPDGSQYIGNFTFVPTVEYGDRTYDVMASQTSLRNSAITTLTMSAGWEGKVSGVQFFRETPTLERIDILSASGAGYAGGYSDMTLSVGNNPNLVYVGLEAGENSTKVHVDKFEVYGPDGNKLQPFLNVEGTDERIYPDAEDTFTLGKNFRTDDDSYCGVLILGGGSGSYNVVLLNVEVNGRIQTIRTEPAQAQGVPAEKVGDIYVKNWINGAIVVPAPEGYEYPEHTVVPARIEIDGVTSTVSNIDPKAFDGADMKSLSLHGDYGYSSVYIENCPNLEKVEWVNNCRIVLSNNPVLADFCFPNLEEITGVTINNCGAVTRVDIPVGITNFGVDYNECENLTSVSIPSSVTELGGFSGCPQLTELSLPPSLLKLHYLQSSYLTHLAIPSGMLFGSQALYNPQAGLVEFEVVENAESHVKVRVSSHITDMSGNVLPLAALPYLGYYDDGNDGIVVPDEDGVMTLERSIEISGRAVTVQRYAFCYDATKGDYTLGLNAENVAVRENFQNLCWIALQLPRYESGVADAETVDENAPVEYYNLQGMRVEYPAAGIYIRRQDSNVTKVIIR